MSFMYSGVVYVFVVVVLGIVLTILSLVISKKVQLSREKLSAFECGFDPLSSSRMTFSLRFFLLAVVFLIFDVELILIAPYVYSVYSGVSVSFVGMSVVFMLVLLLGLMHELNEGSLEWAKS
uniref:NADH-ubiquinone oxidoreductase chain 3 n=1 Tax=Panopea globosa TaxID=1237092 RepID=A0A0U1XJ92_9BIVA|nr:NADH dehydrogenase subunit 3 [Panopea globosa]AIU56064.1 NADH dehydrogenase subunit 3 [Panopea globosa]